MLWLMNIFNKSSSYLIQVLTVTPSVLPSSTVYMVWKWRKRPFFSRKNGRGQNCGVLCMPFSSLNPTKSEILDPPLGVRSHPSSPPGYEPALLLTTWVAAGLDNWGKVSVCHWNIYNDIQIDVMNDIPVGAFNNCEGVNDAVPNTPITNKSMIITWQW